MHRHPFIHFAGTIILTIYHGIIGDGWELPFELLTKEQRARNKKLLKHYRLCKWAEEQARRMTEREAEAAYRGDIRRHKAWLAKQPKA